MMRKTLIAGMLSLALGGGAIALAAGGSSKHKHGGACPMRVSGASVKVVKIDSGVVIHVTSGDAATASEIQAAAAGMGAGGEKTGCKHCPMHGAGPAAKADEAGAAGKDAVYSCPMGCYSGPRTKNGLCPKCAMKLSPKK